MIASSRRFSILQHHHQGVHWDLLIEDDEGTLRTWALVDEPSLEAEIVARQLPAHRRLYLDYSGPISGDRGYVERWDQGTCLVLVWTESRVVVELTGNQLVGLAELTRDGDTPDRDWRFRLGKLS